MLILTGSNFSPSGFDGRNKIELTGFESGSKIVQKGAISSFIGLILYPIGKGVNSDVDHSAKSVGLDPTEWTVVVPRLLD